MARSVIEGGLSKAAAARQFNTTPNTVAKWVDRFRADGVAGLQDCSSRRREVRALATSVEAESKALGDPRSI
jgi:transposase-like protein